MAGTRRYAPSPTAAGALVLAGGFLAYLLSRADEFHVAPLVVALAVLLPLLLPAAGARLGRAGAAPLALVLLLLLAYGSSNRLSALVHPQQLEPIDVAVADGVESAPAEARALEQVVPAVQARVPRGEPIYVLTLRSDLVRIGNPLLYVLAERANPTREDFGLQTSAASQARIVAALERSRPRVLVRWLDPSSAEREPNLRGLASGVRTLDDYVAERYRPFARYGYYELLAPG